MNAFLKEEFVALEQTRYWAQVTNTAHALHSHELLDILLNRRFGVEYQPLVDTQSGETIGFEALSRFYRANGETVARAAMRRRHPAESPCPQTPAPGGLKARSLRA